MSDPLRLLSVEDSEDDYLMLVRALSRAGFDLVSRRVDTYDQMRKALEENEWDIVLSDHSMPEFGSGQALALLGELGLDLPFVIVSGRIGEEQAVQAMRTGACDYVLKDNLTRLAPAIQRELREFQSRRQRSRTEAALHESQTSYRELFNNMGSGVVVYTATSEGDDFLIKEMNKASERICKVTQEQALGRSVQTAFPGVRQMGLFEVFQRVWRTGKAEHFPAKLYEGGDLQAWFENYVYRLPSGDVVAVFDNVTAQKQLEEQLRQAQKMEALGQLAGGVAHDFNNLLTVMLAHVGLLEQNLAACSEVEDSLLAVRDAVDQATGVTRSLLTFSRKVRTDRKACDLCAVVDSGTRILARTLPANIELAIDTSCKPAPWVDADATQLQQVILNLAVNARDAMPDGGTLKVLVLSPAGGESATDAESPHARVVVSDTGTGMSDEVREHLFEPFFTTKTRQRGTGLGLALVHGIIAEHGGRIEVESSSGTGSTFTVHVPTIPRPSVPARLEAPGVVPHGHGETILVTDDQEEIRHLIAARLTSLGYEVVEAGDGDAFLYAYKQLGDKIALCVLDIDLPKRDGLACLRKIRASGAKTPVVLITGSIDAVLEDAGDEHTVLVSKPFRLADLCTLVSQQLQAAAL